MTDTTCAAVWGPSHARSNRRLVAAVAAAALAVTTASAFGLAASEAASADAAPACSSAPTPPPGVVLLTSHDNGRPVIVHAGTTITLVLTDCDRSGPYSDPWARVVTTSGNSTNLALSISHPSAGSVTATFTVPPDARTVALLDQAGGTVPPGAGARALAYVQNISVAATGCQLPQPLAPAVCKP